MTALDLTPTDAPAAAARGQQVWAHALTEARLTLRNGEQLILALVIPIALLVAGRFLGPRVGLDFPALAASVLGLAAWSTCFTSLAISTGFERRYGVLERLIGTPLRRGGLLVGKAISVALLTLGQAAVLLVVALVLGWRPAPHPLQVLIALACFLLAMLTFAGLGLALGGSLRAEATLGLANLVYLGGLAAPGLLYPAPAGWGALNWLPWGALGDALRALNTSTIVWTPLIVLPVTAAAALLLARKVFRWTS